MSSGYDSNVLLIRDLSEEIFKLEDDKSKLTGRIREIESEILGLLTDFYSLSEASDRLDKSPQTLLRGINAKRYTGVNYGGRWYIKRSEVTDESEIKRRLERGI